MLSKSSHRSLWALAGLLVFSGCLGLDTGPGFGILQSVVATGEALPELTNAAGGTASLTVSGRIVGKLPCDEIRGALKEDGGALRLTITVVADRQFCNGSEPTTWSFIANILNLDPGSQRVVVRYRFQGTDGVPGVRLDTVVNVN